MKIILRRDPTANIPKYNEIKSLLQKAIDKQVLTKVNEVSFDRIREILGDNKIPDGHIHQVALDLGLEVEVD